MTAANQVRGGGPLQAVRDFADGMVHGADGDASTLRVIGDIVGAGLPITQHKKAFEDIYQGLKGDPLRLVTGVVTLFPLVGSGASAATKLSAKAGSKAVATAGAQAAKQTISAQALAMSQQVAKGARDVAKSPKTREALVKSGERALELLHTRMMDMGEKGEAPKLSARTHGTFAEAREAAFTSMGESPNKGWSNLVTDDDGKRRVVGRHRDGETGFRIVRPESGEGEQPVQVAWFKNGKTGDLEVGIEQTQASIEEIERILSAYMGRDKSFRSTRQA